MAMVDPARDRKHDRRVPKDLNNALTGLYVLKQELFAGVGQMRLRAVIPSGFSEGTRRGQSDRRLLPFLLQFLRAEGDILGQESGHRCSVSDRFRAT
jgi:hypothetical protein